MVVFVEALFDKLRDGIILLYFDILMAVSGNCLNSRLSRVRTLKKRELYAT
jgi:hypothetical protein